MGEGLEEESVWDVNSIRSALGTVSLWNRRNTFPSKTLTGSSGWQCLLPLVLTPRCGPEWTASYFPRANGAQSCELFSRMGLWVAESETHNSV